MVRKAKCNRVDKERAAKDAVAVANGQPTFKERKAAEREARLAARVAKRDAIPTAPPAPPQRKARKMNQNRGRRGRLNSSGQWIYDGIPIPISTLEKQTMDLGALGAATSSSIGENDKSLLQTSKAELLGASYGTESNSLSPLLFKASRNRPLLERYFLQIRTQVGHPEDLCISVRQGILSLVDIELNKAGVCFSITLYEGRYRIELLWKEAGEVCHRTSYFPPAHHHILPKRQKCGQTSISISTY